MGSFFNNLAAKMQTFMMGRNGADKLSLACLVAAVVIGLINSFLSNLILLIISWALLFYALFRALSTNVAARQAENEKFENLFSRGKRGGGSGAGRSGSGSGAGAGSRSTGRGRNCSENTRSAGASGSNAARANKKANDTLTFECEQCGQKLSVPRGKGTLKVTCPKCHYQQKIKS